MSQPGKKKNILYLLICAIIRLFYRKPVFEGVENIPDEPCVFVGNHTQMNGPIIAELYFPGENYIWCAGQMMHWKEVASYAFTDFWSFKPKIFHPFFRLLSWLITPLSVLLFNNARTVPVYHDTRLITTYRRSIELLQEGRGIIKPVRFDPTAPIEDERARICALMKAEITAMACSLPEHTVVPYRNIPKRLYPKNSPIEVYTDEETGC